MPSTVDPPEATQSDDTGSGNAPPMTIVDFARFLGRGLGLPQPDPKDMARAQRASRRAIWIAEAGKWAALAYTILVVVAASAATAWVVDWALRAIER